MVEYVEKFRPKFQLDFFSDVKILEQAEIPDLITGPAQCIASEIAERSQRRITERASVEESAGHAGRSVGIADQIRALLSVGICETRISIRDCEPIAFGQRSDAPELPSACDLVDQSAGI